MRKINRNNSSEAPLNGDDITLVLSSLIAQETTKVVVLNFWATWCSPCRAEIPGFLDVYKRYKSKGIVEKHIGYISREALEKRVKELL